MKNFGIEKSTHSHRSIVIRGCLFSVIRGLRPANLDPRVKPVDDYKVECGRSMIEMLGVLAIVGVLSVGGIAGYSKAMTKFKTNKVIDQVASIVVNAMTLYSTQKKDDEAYYVNITPEIEKLIYPQDVFSESGDKKHALVVISTSL